MALWHPLGGHVRFAQCMVYFGPLAPFGTFGTFGILFDRSLRDVLQAEKGDEIFELRMVAKGHVVMQALNSWRAASFRRTSEPTPSGNASDVPRSESCFKVRPLFLYMVVGRVPTTSGIHIELTNSVVPFDHARCTCYNHHRVVMERS